MQLLKIAITTLRNVTRLGDLKWFVIKMAYILAALYGLIIGNYLTSAYFRIPRLIAINGFNNKGGKEPHCSVCKHPLKFYEYFPVFNWICVGFSCNYCKTAITPAYTILEVSVTICSVILFYFLGMNPTYALTVLLSAAILLNIALLISHHKIYLKSALGLVLMTSVTALSYLLY